MRSRSVKNTHIDHGIASIVFRPEPSLTIAEGALGIVSDAWRANQQRGGCGTEIQLEMVSRLDHEKIAGGELDALACEHGWVVTECCLGCQDDEQPIIDLHNGGPTHA